MKIKILSDGHNKLRVIDATSGEEVKDVVAVDFFHDPSRGSVATVTIKHVPVVVDAVELAGEPSPQPLAIPKASDSHPLGYVEPDHTDSEVDA